MKELLTDEATFLFYDLACLDFIAVLYSQTKLLIKSRHFSVEL